MSWGSVGWLRGWVARHGALVVVMVVAVVLRVWLWGRLPRSGMISDEGEYFSAASWLAHGRGFAWYLGYLWTRAPVYPLFVAGLLRLFGDSLVPLYVFQTVLSLLNVVLVYVLAWRVLPCDDQAVVSRAAVVAALLMGVYFPFAVYAQVVLSETLYLTLLLGGFCVVAWWQGLGGGGGWRGLGVLGAAGVVFGVATLTRGLTLPFLPLVGVWVAVMRRGWCEKGGWGAWRRGVRDAMVFLCCAGVVIGPWTFYNSRLYGGLVVVDTTGAFNVLLGARTAFDGGRSDAPTRDFVLGLFADAPSGRAATRWCAAPPEPLLSQAARQSAMVGEGVCLIAARPAAFVQKSLAEVVDLFQINYTGDERFTDGFTLGRLPVWYVVGLFVLDDSLYVVTLPLAVVGWALARRCAGGMGVRGLVGVWWVFTIAVAPLLFAINRFRLPLLPFVFLFAAYAVVTVRGGGGYVMRSWFGRLCVVLAGVLTLVATTPYAYVWPGDEGLPSYLGPYPSSVVDTYRALVGQPLYARAEQVRGALREGDVRGAEVGLGSGPLVIARVGKSSVVDAATLARALLAGVAGRPREGLGLLPDFGAISAARDVEAAVVRGDLLRRLGDVAGARAAFTPEFVDGANPVQWAWDWLHPVPTRLIDLGGNLDLGYVEGCYLGERDPQSDDGTFRWCSDGMRLRFPAAGGAAQQLVVRADGRGWPSDMLPIPAVRVLLGDREVGQFTPVHEGVREFVIAVPPTPVGSELVFTLRCGVFLPSARDFLSQQGVLAGQPRRLGVRLDWAELR